MEAKIVKFPTPKLDSPVDSESPEIKTKRLEEERQKANARVLKDYKIKS